MVFEDLSLCFLVAEGGIYVYVELLDEEIVLKFRCISPAVTSRRRAHTQLGIGIAHSNTLIP
jgi:hypothetical protein